MTDETQTVCTVIFALTGRRESGSYEAVVCSPHRRSDVTMLESSWSLRFDEGASSVVECSTVPLETVTHHADAKLIQEPSDDDLIRIAGENSTELFLSDQIETPCLLSQCANKKGNRLSTRVRLYPKSWADTADFQAEQSYWITHYKRRIAMGSDYLKPRLEDYRIERHRAKEMSIPVGAVLPVSVSSTDGTDYGCLILTEQFSMDEYNAELLISGCNVTDGVNLERVVKWNDEGEEKAIQSWVATVLQIDRG